MKSLLIGSVLFLSPLSFAHEPPRKADTHGKEAATDTRIGQGKAIEASDKEEGFKLSLKSMKSLCITFAPIRGSGPWRTPKEALVKLKQSDGVYRRYNGWITLVLVKILSQDGKFVTIQSPDLDTGDEIAVTGAKYLRMTDADLNAGSVDAHGH